MRSYHTIRQLLEKCAGAYSDNTLRGYAADLRNFEGWCQAERREWLPAPPDTVTVYIDAESALVSASTLKRRIAAIKFAHRFSDLPSPVEASGVQLALRRAARLKVRRPAQAKGLTAGILKQIVEACADTLPGLRDAAIISVGYDTLCRSAEIASMCVEHMRRSPGGDWSLLIPISKGDPHGDGRIAWLSPTTSDVLSHWLNRGGIANGPLFRSLHLGRISEAALDTCSIRRLVKRAALRSGCNKEAARGLSGHSMRVGAAQDMLVAGFDSLAIMQAGGWKTPNVLLHYVENAATQTLHERRWEALRSAPRS